MTPSLNNKEHKPGCLANVSCLVIHPDGICPGPYGQCTCASIGNNALIFPKSNNKENYEDQLLSKCCQAPIMNSMSDEMTSFYVCRKCNKASDPVTYKSSKGEKIVTYRGEKRLISSLTEKEKENIITCLPEGAFSRVAELYPQSPLPSSEKWEEEFDGLYSTISCKDIPCILSKQGVVLGLDNIKSFISLEKEKSYNEGMEAMRKQILRMPTVFKYGEVSRAIESIPAVQAQMEALQALTNKGK